jgi:hypothetical protein
MQKNTHRASAKTYGTINTNEAKLVLTYLQLLDPEDLSGASVIMDLAAGVAE